jgi:gas vesicle protein
METFFEIVFAAGFAVVVASFVAVVFRRVEAQLLLWLTGSLAAAAAAAGVVLGINLVERFAESGPLVLATAGLGAAATAEAGLYALVRGLGRLHDHREAVDAARARIDAELDAHVQERAAELERTLTRERANASHALGEQERQLARERRDLIARQADRARAELARSIGEVQERLEQRLTAWAADLDRGQTVLESRLNDLAQRQSQAIAAYEARLSADGEHLRVATEEQQAALVRLRAELQQVAGSLLEESRVEQEAHAAERDRALKELEARMRHRERELRDQIEREELEARTRLASGYEDAARRQLENLDRSLERSATRLTEDAERRFDAQIRASREKTAERLARELDKSIDQFARRAEQEIADRISEVAHSTAARLEQRIVDITKSAEAQHEVSAARLRVVSERLDEAFKRAEDRIAAFELQIETEVTAKREELERTIRAGER